MKLASKLRVGSSIRRKYEAPETPYQRLVESNEVSQEAKEELKGIYPSLNPAQLKRSIDAKLAELYKAYEGEEETPTD